jgi:IclR family KDG regulon transcriptional repressor
MDTAVDRGSVMAVEKAFRLLAELAAGPSPRSAPSLAAALSMSKPTVYRLLRALEKSGAIFRHPEDGAVSLGHRLWELAFSDSQHIELQLRAANAMRQLRDATGETVALYLPLGSGEFVCVATLLGTQDIRRYEQIGRPVPLARGATSMVFLAGLMERYGRETVAAYLDGLPTGLRPARVAEFCERLEAVRRAGYAYTAGMRIPGAASIAAPIRGLGSTVVAALAVTGPADRFTEERVRLWQAWTRQAAASVADALRASADSRPKPRPGRKALGPGRPETPFPERGF